jgi:hypothetical protein
MLRHRAHADDEPSPRSTHYQHCLYLLAELERMIDRTAAGWSPAEAGFARSRLMQIGDKLTRSPTPSQQKRL